MYTMKRERGGSNVFLFCHPFSMYNSDLAFSLISVDRARAGTHTNRLKISMSLVLFLCSSNLFFICEFYLNKPTDLFIKLIGFESKREKVNDAGG
jgi:hypothetical protein